MMVFVMTPMPIPTTSKKKHSESDIEDESDDYNCNVEICANTSSKATKKVISPNNGFFVEVRIQVLQPLLK